MGNILVGIPTRIQVSRCGENLLGHYPTVTGTPATFILRIGWAKRSPPGRGALRLRPPPTWLGTSAFLFFLDSASGRKSLDRSRKFLQFYFFDFGRPRRNRGPTPCNNFPEMKRMQGQKPLSSPGAWQEYLSAT
jgi:hypothetical protein